MPKPKKDIIFVGNPGVGKSTLASAVSGAQFESGVSFGDGKTKILTMVNGVAPGTEDFRFGDTPGLADVKLAEAAAEAIQEAIQTSAQDKRKLKLIFVVTEEAGRIRPADVMSIHKIISSIKLADDKPPPDNCYSIIINKFPKKMFESKRFNEGDPPGKVKMEMPFMMKNEMLSVTTDNIFYMFRRTELSNKNNGKVEDEELLQMLRDIILEKAPELPGDQIKTVEKIKITAQSLKDDTEAYKVMMQAMLKMIEANAEEYKRQHQERMENRRIEMQEWREARARKAEDDRRRDEAASQNLNRLMEQMRLAREDNMKKQMMLMKQFM